MDNRGRGGCGGETGEEEKSSSSARADAAGKNKPNLDDDDDDNAPASASTPALSAPPPPPYTVACTPYTGERAARGLVANRLIRRGETIETAHCVVLSLIHI